MSQQKALDIPFDRMHGPMNLEELNGFLDQGWVVVFTEQSGGGDILVIIEKPDPPAQPL